MLPRSLQRPGESLRVQPTSVPTREFCATITLLGLSPEAFFFLREEEGIIVPKGTGISRLCVELGDLEGQRVGEGKMFTQQYTRVHKERCSQTIGFNYCNPEQK